VSTAPKRRVPVIAAGVGCVNQGPANASSRFMVQPVSTQTALLSALLMAHATILAAHVPAMAFGQVHRALCGSVQVTVLGTGHVLQRVCVHVTPSGMGRIAQCTNATGAVYTAPVTLRPVTVYVKKDFSRMTVRRRLA